jgi:hypothetical protein
VKFPNDDQDSSSELWIGLAKTFLIVPGMTRPCLTMPDFNARVMPRLLRFSFPNDKPLMSNFIYYPRITMKCKKALHVESNCGPRVGIPTLALIFAGS